jgi:hypothetical protein
MTPFGKPAARVTAADIQQLIDDKEPEGRYLEYKRDIPISDEEQKQARGAGRGDPQDRSWLQNRPLRAFGRDKLMEELVAFANADGGVLILGITETKSEPARANGFNLLPDVVSLERRLRDALVDCIEPRLPFASVVAVPIAPSGEGVVILETEPSRLGPHRVRRTREATIRREDRCDQMTMAEIHDMVIHNARRFDAVTATLEERAEVFQKTFFRTLLAHVPDSTVIVSDPEGRVDMWFAQEGMAAFGLRVTLVPHDDLGIPRLQDLAGLVPPHQSLQRDGEQPVSDSDLVWISEHEGRPLLGGVEQFTELGNFVRYYCVRRDGLVEGTALSWSNMEIVDVELLVATVACVLGVYDRLREKAGAPSMPAEIGIEVLTRGKPIVPRVGSSVPFARGHTPLERKTTFPIMSVSDREGFTEVVNAVAGDLVNASGLNVSVLPKYRIT